MNRILILAITVAFSYSTLAGAGGLVLKGVFRTWDELAKVALKASGKVATGDAVKASAKEIEKIASRYGDDIAEVAMRGGVEVAEQSLKHGGSFVRYVKTAATYSDDAVKAIARNADDVVRYTAKYGDDVVALGCKAPGVFTRGIALVEKSGVENVGQTLKVVATQIPDEQIPQVFGAIQKNPTVAKQFLEGVVKGGKYFVDKIFAVNGKQIMAGTLGTAAIIAASNLTAPAVAEGDAVEKQTDAAIKLIENKATLTPDQKEFVGSWLDATSTNRRTGAISRLLMILIVVAFAGGALLVFVIRKTRKIKHFIMNKKLNRKELTK